MQAKILTFDPFGFLKQWASIGWLETYILSVKKKKKKILLDVCFLFYVFIYGLSVWHVGS